MNRSRELLLAHPILACLALAAASTAGFFHYRSTPTFYSVSALLQYQADDSLKGGKLPELGKLMKALEGTATSRTEGQMKIATSQPVVRQTLIELGRLDATSSEAEQERLVRAHQQRLSAALGAGPGTFRLHFSSSSARFGHQFMARLIEVYGRHERQLRLKTNKELKERLLEPQVVRLKQRAAEQRKLLRRHGAVQQLQSSETRLQSQVEAHEQKIAAKVHSLREERQRLRGWYKESHPAIRRLDLQLAAVERIRAATDPAQLDRPLGDRTGGSDATPAERWKQWVAREVASFPDLIKTRGDVLRLQREQKALAKRLVEARATLSQAMQAYAGPGRTLDEQQLADLPQELSSNEKLLVGYESRLRALTLSIETVPPAVNVIEPPPVDPPAQRLDPGRYALFTAVLGVAFALGLCLVADRLSRSDNPTGSVEHATGARVLCTVPTLPDPRGTREKLRGQQGYERLLILTGNLQSVGFRAGVLLLTSARATEGKTTLAANLGLAILERQGTCLLVSADPRKPDLERLVQIEEGPGLAEASGFDPAQAAGLEQQTEESGLFALAGGVNPASCDAGGLKRYLEDAARRHGVVLLDGPDMESCPDVVARLAACATGVLLVHHHTSVPVRLAQWAAGELRKSGARVLGVALNDGPPAAGPDESSDMTLAVRGKRA